MAFQPYSVLHTRKCQCDRCLYGGYSAIGCYTWKTKSDRVELYPLCDGGGGETLVLLSWGLYHVNFPIVTMCESGWNA